MMESLNVDIDKLIAKFKGKIVQVTDESGKKYCNEDGEVFSTLRKSKSTNPNQFDFITKSNNYFGIAIEEIGDMYIAGPGGIGIKRTITIIGDAIVTVPDELTEKLEILLEKLAGRHGRCESNVQICYTGKGTWGFFYDGDFSGPYEWEKLEEKIYVFCQ